MKQRNLRSLKHGLHIGTLLPIATLSVGLAVPSPAAHATIAEPDEIIVTARRTEEVLQNVPIAMTVFNQQMLDERNVVDGSDLATFTPSLSVNTRFGTDQASFAIRGFTQEFRTTASVAVYFADVVAPRGGGASQAGDGAGPGSFFDLQNVQVLKGPQGTLFGRNTTGGAIQLVPQEPTNKLEGYLEQSVGDYDMRRTQGVINVPINDIARARFGVDILKRDGYLNNVSGTGPSHLANTDYQSARASLMVDPTDTLQNYTILTFTHSQNNGGINGLFACDPKAQLASLCEATLSHQGSGFYDVSSDTQDPLSKLQTWQAINTTTWNVSDNFTVKNIFSYANLYQNNRSSIFGSDFHLPDSLASYGVAGAPLAFYPSGGWPGIANNSQTSLVEELQFSGTALNEKLTWQGGLYFENSKPDGISGALSPSFISCLDSPSNHSNPANWSCFDALGSLSGGQIAGSVASNLGEVEYINKAVYSQGTYDINDQFRATLGARYTVDQTNATSQQSIYSGFPSGLSPAEAPGGPTTVQCVIGGAALPDCKHKTTQKSEAPTWLIDFDYLPTPDVMVYTKYARGYRQGSVNMFAPEGLQTYQPEKVDSYEVGAKTTFPGPIPGTFNVAAFYNQLSNQQLQGGYIPVTGTIGSATTAILNAGSSTIQGFELDSTFKLSEGLALNLAYTYLDTRLDSLTPPELPAHSLIQYQPPFAAAVEGGHLTFSPRHDVTLGLSYRLPVPAELGDMSLGATYNYVSDQISTVGAKYGVLPERNLLNLNAGWKAIFGSAFDTSLFVTNVTNEQITSYVPGLYEQGGMEFRTVGEPRMWGARLKYNFGL